MTLPRHPCASEQSSHVVLLVEDDPFVREATCRILQGAGFHVLPAADAQEAMKAYESNQRQIDLLMTDMVLPGRSGRQLAEEVRETSPAMPILLTSGYLESETGAESCETQTYYLAKPYSRAELVAKMEGILSQRPSSRAASQTG